MKNSVIGSRGIAPGRAAPAAERTIHYSDLSPSPVGQVTLIVSITDGSGVQPARPLRIYPDYAWVLITKGQGRYFDAQGRERRVQAGNAILVLPGHAHSYQPDPHTLWDELYVVFNGPAFDAWAHCGVLTPDKAVCSLPATRDWVAAIKGLIEPEEARRGVALRRALEVCRLLTLLTEAMGGDTMQAGTERSRTDSIRLRNWIGRALALLTDPSLPVRPIAEIAADLGVSVETFRRRFQAEAGQPPARWRAERHIETACHWMIHTDLTNAQIAARLGYADEFHFSRRFRQLRGIPPSEFRRRRWA